MRREERKRRDEVQLLTAMRAERTVALTLEGSNDCGHAGLISCFGFSKSALSDSVITSARRSDEERSISDDVAFKLETSSSERFAEVACASAAASA